jgi:polyhydroxyalkanoate synthesis regulator phasin
VCCANEEVQEKVKDVATDGKLSCAQARQIAEDLSVELQTINCACEKVGVILVDCECGCS